jgi:Lar family restriction alleviation protein
MTEKLKPCPFCGGEAKLTKQPNPVFNAWLCEIRCTKCHASPPVFYTTSEDEIIKRWNQRTPEGEEK